MLIKKDSYVVAVVGATGAVGNEMIKTLEQRNFPVGTLRLFASERSVGKELTYKGKPYKCEALTPECFKGIDIALFSAGGSRSEQWAPIAAKSGCVVVDNSSQWRMDPTVPLVVPEVNPHDLKWHKGIIANPNCSTIQMVVVLKPIHDAAKIKRVVVSTYQSVSGTGAKAMIELKQQAEEIVAGKPVTKSVYPHQIAFNLIPQIDSFLDSGYTKEEIKMVNETVKILGDPSVKVTATTVRVPVYRCHSECVNIETERDLSPEQAKEVLSKAPGVVVYDDPKNGKYPVPIDVAGKDDTYVGRIRRDETVAHGLNLWVVSDNLRKGAALNAVQIAEKLVEMA